MTPGFVSISFAVRDGVSLLFRSNGRHCTLGAVGPVSACSDADFQRIELAFFEAESWGAFPDLAALPPGWVPHDGSGFPDSSSPVLSAPVALH